MGCHQEPRQASKDTRKLPWSIPGTRQIPTREDFLVRSHHGYPPRIYTHNSLQNSLCQRQWPHIVVIIPNPKSPIDPQPIKQINTLELTRKNLIYSTDVRHSHFLTWSHGNWASLSYLGVVSHKFGVPEKYDQDRCRVWRLFHAVTPSASKYKVFSWTFSSFLW